MLKNFGDENFEEFLRENSEGLRMKPSNEVWNKISSRLSRKKRRAGFFLSFALLATSAVGYILADRQNDAAMPLENATNNVNQQPFTVIRGSKTGSTAESNYVRLNKVPAPSGLTAHTEARMQQNIITALAPVLAEATVQPTQTAFVNQSDDSHIDMPAGNEPMFSMKQAIKDPLTIESLNKPLKIQLDKKIRLQYYFTPTFSYRKLGENKSFLLNGNAAPSYLSYSNVKSMVTHKPDLGLELGVAGRYRLTQSLTLKAGLQMNVSRYDMKTYSSSSELATIHLNSADGSSIKSITHYNNFSGYKSNWIQNFYLQASAPVGLEVKISGTDRMQFGIGTTIQPTYVISDRNYVLSTDYKNYAEVPGLTRRWNVNSSMEAFIAYNAGDLRWQIGPQLRYQLLSSFVTAYPVKENLMDMGLKIAVSRNPR